MAGVFYPAFMVATSATHARGPAQLLGERGARRKREREKVSETKMRMGEFACRKKESVGHGERVSLIERKVQGRNYFRESSFSSNMENVRSKGIRSK